MLSLAARSGMVDRIESLRIAGADLNATDEIKQTPLHKVSNYNGNTEKLELNGYEAIIMYEKNN